MRHSTLVGLLFLYIYMYIYISLYLGYIACPNSWGRFSLFIGGCVFLFLFYATLGCIIMYTDMFDEPT